MKKTSTISLSGKQYAQVKDRIKEFRSDNPRGSITTEPTITESHIVFKAHIVRDKSDEHSADATGHSMGVIGGNNKEKQFEKQETIAVGRALALLGYASDGEIASSEEMEEYESWKKEQMAEQIMEATESIGHCETLEQLQELWQSLSGEMKTHCLAAKDAKKDELVNQSKEK